MKRLILTASLFAAIISFASAAPLQPINTSIDMSINGTVNISGDFPPQRAPIILRTAFWTDSVPQAHNQHR